MLKISKHYCCKRFWSIEISALTISIKKITACTQYKSMSGERGYGKRILWSTVELAQHEMRLGRGMDKSENGDADREMEDRKGGVGG